MLTALLPDLHQGLWHLLEGLLLHRKPEGQWQFVQFWKHSGCQAPGWSQTQPVAHVRVLHPKDPLIVDFALCQGLDLKDPLQRLLVPLLLGELHHKKGNLQVGDAGEQVPGRHVDARQGCREPDELVKTASMVSVSTCARLQIWNDRSRPPIRANGTCGGDLLLLSTVRSWPSSSRPTSPAT